MKKIVHILIMMALVTFTACSSEANVTSQGIEIKTNNIPITEPSKSETRYTLVESEKSDYEFMTTLTQSDLTDLIPAEYENFDYVEIESLDDGVVYISTGKGSGKDREVKDVFAYNLDSDTITHIADISKLNFVTVNIFEVDGNLYFYTIGDSNEKLALHDGDKLSILSDEYFAPIETPNGVAFPQTSTRSIIEFEGVNQTVITPELFPSILYTYDPIRYVSLSNGQILLCTIENNKMTSILDLPEYDLALFSDYFWVEHGDETNILSMYNYNNEEMLSFEDKPSIYTGQTNDNTMFRIDLDDNIWIYKCDEENKTVTKSMLEGSKARTRNVFSDDNYVIRCYPNSYEAEDYAYDIYREK